MTVKRFMKASAAEPCCAVCGRDLTDAEILVCLSEKIIPACLMHKDEAKIEMRRGTLMWPSHWYGHVWKEGGRHWRISDKDGGEYEWPITY